MRKGIVMEIEEKFLTVLTPDGQFMRAEKQENRVLGEEIIFTPLKQRSQLKRLIGIKQLSAAAAILLILLGSLIPWYQNDKAYAYMSIDGNPSIEIGINKNMQVVKLSSFNNEGKNIISHISSWKKENITLITEAILKEMEKQGYLKKNQSITISTVRIEKPEEKTEQQFTTNMNKIEQFLKADNVNLIVIKGTEQDLEKAHRLGMTTGKYKEETADATLKKENKQKTAIKHKTDKNVTELQGTRSNNRSDTTAEAAGVHKTKVDNSGTANNENKIPLCVKQKNNEITKKQTQRVNHETTHTNNQEKSITNNGQIKKQEKRENNRHSK